MIQKTGVWMLALILTLGLAGCAAPGGDPEGGNGSDSSAAETESESQAAESTEAESSEGESTEAELETLSADELSVFTAAVEAYEALPARYERVELMQIVGEGDTAQEGAAEIYLKEIVSGEDAQVEAQLTQDQNGTVSEGSVYFQNGTVYMAYGDSKLQVAGTYEEVAPIVGAGYISALKDVLFSSVEQTEEEGGGTRMVLTMTDIGDGMENGVVELLLDAEGQITSMHVLQDGTVNNGTEDVKVSMEITVEVLGTGDEVQITFPDFSEYEEAGVSAETESAAGTESAAEETGSAAAE